MYFCNVIFKALTGLIHQFKYICSYGETSRCIHFKLHGQNTIWINSKFDKFSMKHVQLLHKFRISTFAGNVFKYFFFFQTRSKIQLQST